MPSKDQEVIRILKKVGAIYTNDHFVLTSGKHSPIYLNKDTLYLHPSETSKVGRLFAKKFFSKSIEMVVAPAVGGTILSQWTAYHLSTLKKKEILCAYTEKSKGTLSSAVDDVQIFRRGYDKAVKGKKVLVVEDLTSTGISVHKVVEAVKSVGGIVVAVCVMVNRDPDNVTSKSVGAPFSSLANFKVDQYDPAVCPMCKKGVPVNTSLGHGKKYLESKKAK